MSNPACLFHSLEYLLKYTLMSLIVRGCLRHAFRPSELGGQIKEREIMGVKMPKNGLRNMCTIPYQSSNIDILYN